MFSLTAVNGDNLLLVGEWWSVCDSDGAERWGLSFSFWILALSTAVELSWGTDKTGAVTKDYVLIATNGKHTKPSFI